MLSVAILTTITGQRSRAEMNAKDVLSEVAYGATGTSVLDPMLLAVVRWMTSGATVRPVGLLEFALTLLSPTLLHI